MKYFLSDSEIVELFGCDKYKSTSFRKITIKDWENKNKNKSGTVKSQKKQNVVVFKFVKHNYLFSTAFVFEKNSFLSAKAKIKRLIIFRFYFFFLKSETNKSQNVQNYLFLKLSTYSPSIIPSKHIGHVSPDFFSAVFF